jgi:eukaryotic-like serine/threonine-protein kinase
VEGPERYGPYLVYEQIGSGGMATVHRAEWTTKTGTKQIALKRMNPTMQRELVAVFMDEARLHKYLDHPNIAATYDSGRHFGTYFIAMEYIPGPTLKQLVEHCGKTVGAVPHHVTLNLVAQLCAALDHAHTLRDEHGNPLGIVHRDITPSNVIVSPSGEVKLIDFGLAKAQVNTEQTKVGVIKGKFGYVAPEYLRRGRLDHRADLWAVGIIMYELLTNRRLFDGPDAMETMTRVCELPIPRPSIANPKVTPALDELALRALERDPERRWQSAREMREALLAVIAQPGNVIDNKGVSDWVTWALAQDGKRQVQLTPMFAMPTTPLPDPTDIVRLPPPPLPTPSRQEWLWVIGLAVLLFVMLVLHFR